VDDIPILGRDDARNDFNRFVAHFDGPAYIRRARQVQDAFDALVGRCRRQRDEWLEMVRLRLGRLRGLAGDWPALAPLLTDAGQVQMLRTLHQDLKPHLRLPVAATSSERMLRRALGELCASIERFNHRWKEFLRKVDFTAVNQLRADYNRYYVLEKECAVRNPRLARQGFRPLVPATVAELAAAVPPLPVPQLWTKDAEPR
jgi:hypothetical protein